MPLALAAGFPGVAFFVWLSGFGRGASVVKVTGACSFSAALGSAAADWGSYYESVPIVVAGRIRLALERFGSRA